MKLNNFAGMVVVIGLLVTSGCETVYMSNTVYQYDAVSSEEDLPLETEKAVWVLPDTGLDFRLTINNCFTGHFEDLAPFYVRPNSCEIYEDEGFCCKWTSETTQHHLCEEEWCYWKDTCDWDLNGWGQVCNLKEEK
tara:strand:+ start:398 stop:805 length:408 start_codon:yes stop_codon:yes gene_type:complete